MRESVDRRRKPTSVWAAFRPGGRRTRQRRREEHRQPYFVDRFPPTTFLLILVLLFSTVADGVMTVLLLDADCAELNPLMGYLLKQGLGPFFLGKYALTVAGLPFLLVFKNHYLFRTRFRVGYLIPVFVLLYACLLAYQLYLCSLLLADQPAAWGAV